MTNVTSRVPAIVDALVAADLIDPARSVEARAVLARTLGTPEPQPTTSRGLMAEIAAYVGGALVVASVGLFLAQQWADFSETVQVGVLAAITVLLALAGLTVSRVAGGYAELRAGRDDVRRRLSAALLTGSALAAAFTVGRFVEVAFGEEGGSSEGPVLLGALTGAVLAALAYIYATSVLGQVAMVAGLFMAAIAGWQLLDLDVRYEALVNGLTFLVIGLAWVGLAEGGVLREKLPGRAIGAAMSLFGAQLLVFGDDSTNLGYALMLTVSIASFVMYLRTVSWPYLAVGVLGITLVVPEAIIDWTGDSLGPAGGVLVAGLTLLGASLTGLRLRREAAESAGAGKATEQPGHPDATAADGGANATASDGAADATPSADGGDSDISAGGR